MSPPPAILSVAITPKTQADKVKMEIALAELASVESSLKVRTDAASDQTILAGTSELHLDTLVDRMMRAYTVELSVGKP